MSECVSFPAGNPVNSAPLAAAANAAAPDQAQPAPSEKASSVQRLFTKRQIADYNAVTTRTVDEWMRTGKIPFRKIGRTVRFNLAEVEEYQRANFLITRRSARILSHDGGAR